MVLRVESRYSHLIPDRNTSIHPARRRVRDTTIYNILHYIDKGVIYIRVEARRLKNFKEILQKLSVKEKCYSGKVKHDIQTS